MFTYLHCYMPETWQAQIDAGLVRPGDGIRYSQSIDIDEHLKFNNLAKIGGDLYNYVKEHRCPLYIDRLQGGCFLEEYPYDMALVDEYRRLLGDRFWGFQMHEWMSNVSSDLRKITNNNCPAWTAEAITETIHRAYPFAHTFLEAMNAEEYAAMGLPGDAFTFLAEMEKLFAKRQAYTGGDLLPCDSAYQGQALEIKYGAKRLMPEIGAQTPQTNVQIAYARGMARAAGIPFGTYYEPWGGDPFSSCCYQREEKNEWNISAESFPFRTAGGNGGSSRSMQLRMHLYSYMAGASFMAEEWGMCNTFYDWKDFELSPYGQVKKDFLDFTDRYPDIGEPITPAAIVLPKEMPVIDIGLSKETYLGYPVEGAFQKKLACAVDAIHAIFTDGAPMLGTEPASLRNTYTPDAVDIITEDAANVDAYPILIDATGNPAFAAAHKDRILDTASAKEKLFDYLPIKKVGGASMQITHNRETGAVYVMLLNNSGVVRSVANGETFLPEADTTVSLTVKDGKRFEMLEGTGTVSASEGESTYQAAIPAGGWVFGRIS
ncbi:MAG: hypothetical protein J6I50_07515 [Clostridia bacterium]|nr:hypothetical protein [Clostridia bacterium]